MADPRDPSAEGDLPTLSMPAVDDPQEPTRMHVRLFGSTAFFRLWLTQVVSATGDWLGFLAIAALATRLSPERPEAAIGLVMSARIVPGFFLGPAAGVFADRFDRKRLMVLCDIGRALVLATLPFVDTVPGLIVASLVLEVFTLLWAPAKEASVPHIVPSDHLTTANSLSLVAAYGTIPLAAGIFSLLAKASEWLGDFELLTVLRGTPEGLAFYFDAATFGLSALMIYSLPLPRRRKEERARTSGRRIEFGSAWRELREGWEFVFINPVVRSVNLGLATGLIGGGMLVPLGPVFAEDVLGSGQAGFGVLIFALGLGVAGGVVTISVFQKRVPKEWAFVTAVFVAGASLLAAASMSAIVLASVFVFVLGVCAGTVYVLGFTMLHEHVEDDLRGRIFSALYTLVRLCVLISFAVGPFLSELFGELSDAVFDDNHLSVFGASIAVPGVVLTLWTAGLIIVAAGFIAASSMRDAARKEMVDMPKGTGSNGTDA
ncbi:MFS transporter [Actinospongicola halichondriae]|uniref:MFS transporter n=1 Tax=Actinospongicola halichondriae TaxID=3236844 RepID=UPI003D49CB0E